VRVSPAADVIIPKPKDDKGHPVVGGCMMFRMIFAIVVGVMEKTPKRDRPAN
jgi:hypothetical protein